ncbi:MAG: HAMP domain-containing sensor histidine kinase [Oculatellaceae cyanobacterium bins.114]|nr:HAMP domain-containing sensor histidine kinase [Oculatellaceae cyanobacterium bins.114]
MAVSKQQSVTRALSGRRVLEWLRTRTFQLESLTGSSTSAEYRTWQRQFLGRRLRLLAWLALLCNVTFAVINLYNLVLHPDLENIQLSLKLLDDPLMYERIKRLVLISDWVTNLLLLLCLLVQRTSWGSRHPILLFLAISWSMTLIPEVLGTLNGVPFLASWNFIFMAQVVLMPINWQLHLFSQLVSIGYYFGGNGILGVTKIPGASGLFDLETIFSALWICLICDVAVYLYDRLQYREFESRRELRLFLHAVTHDLRTPVIGTSIVLQNLLKKAIASDGKAIITATKLEQILAGSDRQLNLIDSILEAHNSETKGVPLRCEPLPLSTLVEAVIADSEALLNQNQIVVINQIDAHLPLIQADVAQLCRVFSNLITNAIQHNPSGIQLTLDATLQTPHLIRCTVHDNGIGISLQQQKRLFELYYRGTHSRYTPGLGLGLYVCQQIIQAHGGDIGVTSQAGLGTTFWFTLPVAPRPTLSAEQ